MARTDCTIRRRDGDACRRRAPFFAGLLAAPLVAGSIASAPIAAQETSALQAAVAIEGALIHAIAQAEKSVVAIARVKHGDRDEVGELRADPFGVPRIMPARPN